jgi:hypothetical protein
MPASLKNERWGIEKDVLILGILYFRQLLERKNFKL